MNKYLVALCSGGIMENPEITYSDFEVIDADSIEEAVEKYNKKNNCSYFYGTCVAENVNGIISILPKTVSQIKTRIRKRLKYFDLLFPSSI